MVDFKRYEIRNSEFGIIPGTDLIFAKGHEVGYGSSRRGINAEPISNLT